MAKITLENGMVIEGTVEELKEMAKSFVELKGYRKVDRRPQVGDFVKFSENVCDVTPGKYYEVTKLDSDGDPMIIDDIDDEYCLYGGEDSFEVFEKVDSVCDEPEPDPLKVGDYAKIIGDDTTKKDLCGSHCFEVGEIVSVVREFSSKKGFECKKLSGETTFNRNVSSVDVIPATDEEVSEAKRWAKIGRKPNELKVGDVVKRAPGHYDIVANPYGGLRLDEGEELVAPVESRFDRA